MKNNDRLHQFIGIKFRQHGHSQQARQHVQLYSEQQQIIFLFSEQYVISSVFPYSLNRSS